VKRLVLGEKVHYYENAIVDFKKLIDTIKDLSKNDKDAWEPWYASDSKNVIYGETKTFNSKEFDNFEEIDRIKMNYIYEKIMESFYNVCKDYAGFIKDENEPIFLPAFDIKKYYQGTHMGAHFDQLGGDETLKYSLVMYLNEDYEGGEISFTLNDLKNSDAMGPFPDYSDERNKDLINFGIKPKAGSVIIFPSFSPYYHTAHLVKSGVKYMVPAHWIKSL
jgi:hypothetical protein